FTGDLGSPNMTGVFVCACKRVTDRTIEAAVASGADTLEEVGNRCGAGMRCGGCHPFIEGLLEVRAAEPEAMAAA
ncbi:MAG TPA: (2Fe-2S)-binding protein, partial [Acidimicrobiales bacterium]|nr:(2Fe-2S)-binding protein [Acidimicrobiales bacterium]